MSLDKQVSESFTTAESGEDLQRTAFVLILDKYKDAQESLSFGLQLISESSLQTFLSDCEAQIDKNPDLGSANGFKKTLQWIKDLSKQELTLIQEDCNYLINNLPNISDYSTFTKFSLALGIGLANGIKATVTKHAITAYLALKSAEAVDQRTQSIYAGLATINAISSLPLSPSISRIISFIDYTFFEEIILRLYKGEDIRNTFKFSGSDFMSKAKFSLLLEGSGIFILIPLEILRMFDLDEVSPKTLQFWRKLHKLRALLAKVDNQYTLKYEV
ncbi:hypothetical protein IT417_03775 [bacterium]|nr:hypothetical protein [bacterium]